MDIPIEDVKVKASYCQKCNGFVRVAILHEMVNKSKKGFMKEAMKYDLGVKTLSLQEYRENKIKFCECKYK